MDLQEKQFELGGVVFGLGTDIAVLGEGFTPGSAETRTNDKENPTGDGVRFGIDRKGSATWGFSLYTDCDDEVSAWEALDNLAAAWDADDVRGESGEPMPLRYRLAGRTKRVYGRPTRWTHTPNNLSMAGRIDVEADFRTVDQRVYDDDLQTKIVTIVPPLDTEAGVILPVIMPFVSSAGDGEQQDQITIGGTMPTPIILTFTGAVGNAKVVIGDWVCELGAPVPDNESVIVDARPWVRSATYEHGGGFRLNARTTRIAKMWLKPGTYSVTFTGEDLSGNAAVLVSWRNAGRTPR